MVLLNPPAYLQGGTYTAVLDRQYLNTTRFYKSSADNSRARSGLLPDTAAWSAPIGISGFNVTIGPFRAVLSNQNAANAGDYVIVSPNSEVRTLAGSSTTTNRIDVIGYRVRDAFYSGTDNDADVVVIAGTPAAGTPAVPPIPTNVQPLYQLTVNANSAAPTSVDVRQRTGLIGTPVPIFANQVGQSGVNYGEARILPAGGVMPPRTVIWGEDSAWHGITPFVIDFGGWVNTSNTTDRIVATLTVPDPGYAYRLFFSGAVWAGIDGDAGWRFAAREGTGAGGTIYAQGAYEKRDATYDGPNSIPVAGSSGSLTGARTISLWVQRKFGVSTQGIDVGAESEVSTLLVPA